MTSNKDNPSKKNMSNWIIEAGNRGIDLKGFYTLKLDDIKRLKESRLPMCEIYIIPYSDFINLPSHAEDFLNKYAEVVILAIPDTPLLPRAHKMGISSYDECKNFLIQEGTEQNKNHYSVVLINPEGKNKQGGIIISRDTSLLIEIVEGKVEDLSYGAAPSVGYLIDFTEVGLLENKIIWYKGGSSEDKKLVRDILSCLTINPNSFSNSFNPFSLRKSPFRRGYFEFVITQKNEIKFIDYKENEMYLK
jgi:hypothetical protein